ncbi:hypothetical protein CRG98_003400, partial [Punica granatum]
FASSPSQLARASCNLAGSTHPCEFISLLRKFAEPARLCLIQSCRVCSPVGVYFSASQVRRASSLVPHTILPDLLTRASLLFRFASSPSLLARASCHLAGSAHPCEFTFLLPKFAESARSCLLQPCLVRSPVRVYFSASQVLRDCSLMPIATFPDLLTRASLLFRFASSPSLLARASCHLAGSAHPCEFTFLLPKFAESARSCLLQPCLVRSPVRVYFSASQVLRDCSLMPIATFPDLLTRASLLFRFASSPSLLARASCHLAGSAHPCEFTFLLPKFAESARSCLLQPCLVRSPVRVYFSASQVLRDCSLMPIATFPDLLTRASLLFRFASSPSLLARASCHLAGSAHPCEFTFLLPKFAESARSCLLQPCLVRSPVRVYFSASQVLRDCSLMPIATFPDLLTRASLLFRFASSPSLLACASYNLAGSAHPCVFIFLLRKFAEPAPLCLIQSCRVSSPVRVYCFCFASSPSLLACASYILAGSAHPSPSLLARASCNLAWSTHPWEFTSLLRKFAEPARLCLIQSCRVCSPVRVYFSASQIRRACSLVPHTILPGLLTRAGLLFRFANSPSLLACASYNLAGSAHPCGFTFPLRKFAEPARLCLIQSCRVCSPVRVYFSASQIRRACSLVPHTILPGLLTRAGLLFRFANSPSLLACASYNLAGSAHPCGFTFPLRKFAEPARLCLIQSCRVCSPVRVYFSASQIRRACSLVPHTILPGLLTRAGLLFRFANSPSLLACASYNLAGSAHPCEFTFLLRKFAEPARSCILQPRLVYSPVGVYFSASQVRRACSIVPHTILPGLLTPGSLLFCFASSPSLLACASYNLAGSAHPCGCTFPLRKFAEPARLCLIHSCRVCSPVRVYFSASQVRRVCSLVPLATSPSPLTCASLLFGFASSPRLLAHAYCNLSGSAHPCEFTFLLPKFAESARSCLLQPRLVRSPVRVYFSASQVLRDCSLMPIATFPDLLTRLLTRASLLFYVASSPSLLACASNNLAGSAHPCEFTFLLRKFAEPPRLCLIQSCRVCSPVRVYFSASQVRRVCSLVPLATLPGLLTCASLLFGCASSPSLLVRASCNLAGSAHLCEFTFPLLKIAETSRSCLLQPCRVCSPVRVYFSTSQVRRVCSLVPLATLPGLLTRASLLFCFANSPSLLACASYNLAGSAHPCAFIFLFRKFAEPAPLCLIQSCQVSSPVRVYFSASQVRRDCSLVPLATLLGLLTRASSLFYFPSSPSLLARTSCNLAWPAHPSEFTFLLPKFAESARSYLLQPCLACSPERVYFSASQVRRVCSLVPLATLPGLLTRASLLFCFPSSPSLLARTSCNLAWPAHPSEFTFLLPKFAESARSYLLQPCLACSPERVYFSASQVRRVCSLVPLATLPGLLTRASLLFCFPSSPSLLARASCNLAGSAHPCEFTFLLRKFAEPARLCLIQSCRVSSPVRVYFFSFASSPNLLACASYILAGSAHPCEFTFLLPKFAESARSCLLQPCRVCSPVRVYFSTSQVRRVCSLVPLATLPGLLTRASLLFYFPSSPSLLARASCNLAGSAHPCEFTFLLPKFAESARSCLLQPCRVCSPVRVYFSTSQVRRVCSLVPLATLPGLLTRASLLFYFPSSPSLLARASCNLAGSAHPCEFTFLLPKFAESARSCLLQPCRVCSPVRVYFSTSQVRRVCSLVPLATLPGLLTRASLLFYFPSSPSLLARASCNLAGSAHPCEFTFLLPKFAESARSCLLQPCRVCSPVRVYFSTSQVRRVCSLVPLATLPGLLTRASLLFYFPSSPSLLARASCNLAWSAHLCEFSFRLRKFSEPARSCLLQPFRVCSSVRVYFSASKVRRACSLVHLATLPVRRASSLVPHTFLPGLLTRVSLLFCFANSPSLLACASYILAGSAHLCEFTFRLCKFAEPASSCHLQPCWICSLVRVYFSASQVRRACSLVHLATLPGLLTRASLLFCFAVRLVCSLVPLATLPGLLTCASLLFGCASSPSLSLVPHTFLPGRLTRASSLFYFPSSPSLLARTSCNLAWSAHLCELTFRLRKFSETARSCLLQPFRVCSPVRVYFSASQVRRACSLVPHKILPGLLTCASLLFCFANSPSLLACVSYNPARSAHPCEFTFLLRKFAVPAHLCLIKSCRVCSPVRVYFSASQIRRACSLVSHTILPGTPSLLACASYNLAGSARSCLLQPCLVCSPVRVYFSASQVLRACSVMPIATFPGLLTRASLLFRFASSLSLLARASCHLAGSVHPREFTFLLRKFTEPARLCLIQSCQVCSPVRVYFSASQVRRASSLVPHTILPGLLTRACLFFCFASSPSLLPCASYNLAGSAHPCEIIFLASQVRRACSLVPHKFLPGLLTRASLLFYFPSSPSLLTRASCNLAWSAHLCEFTFPLRKFAEPARSCILPPCRVCSPVRVYFSASHVLRACSLMPIATFPDLLTRVSLLFCFTSSPSLLARASCHLAGSAHPCEFTFLLRKFAETARLCLIQSCQVCSPVRVYFSASQVRRACSLVPQTILPDRLTRASLLFCFASSPSLFARASCNRAWFANPCEFTFLLRRYAEPARSCLIQPCRVCTP